jgi:3-hydroxyisobutyrate dehydrogenase-like beta-hydroxyacid dehydrogenase
MMTAVHESMQLTHASGIDQEVLAHVLGETDVAGMAFAPLGFGGPGPAGPEMPVEPRSLLEHTRNLGDKDLHQALALADDLHVGLAAIAAVRKSFHLSVRMPEARNWSEPAP